MLTIPRNELGSCRSAKHRWRVLALRVVSASLLSSAQVACAGPTEWDAPLAAPLAIQDLAIDGMRSRADGVLFVRAAPEDWAYQMPAGNHVTATVSTSGGDAETIRLSRDVCGLDAGEAYSCRTFLITLRTGNDLRDFKHTLHRLRARLVLVPALSGYRFGSVYAFGDRAVTMRVLGFDDQVERVENMNVLTGDVRHSEPPMSAWLSGAVALEVGSSSPQDGLLTVQPGDTVTVRYAQPTGDVLETRLVIAPLEVAQPSPPLPGNGATPALVRSR